MAALRFHSAAVCALSVRLGGLLRYWFSPASDVWLPMVLSDGTPGAALLCLPPGVSSPGLSPPPSVVDSSVNSSLVYLRLRLTCVVGSRAPCPPVQPPSSSSRPSLTHPMSFLFSWRLPPFCLFPSSLRPALSSPHIRPFISRPSFAVCLCPLTGELRTLSDPCKQML